MLLCWKAYMLFVSLALYPSDSGAVDLSQCLSAVISCAANSSSPDCVAMDISNTTALSILRTSHGSPIVTIPSSTDPVTALSFAGCVEYCGVGQESFSWTVFSQRYSAWLLPYLAMLSQLPFGARRRTDNLMSAILTIGSPTLAGYSLFLTFLNARWVNDKLFAEIDYPSVAVRQSVVLVLSSLQQVPLRVHPGASARFESLVVHPDNDDWWTTFAVELDYHLHTWSIASATAIVLGVIAYLLTVINSFANVADHMSSSGQGTGSAWLWLLPIVVGWLVLSPKCDYTRVHRAYDKANERAFAANFHDGSAAPTQVAFNFGLTISSPDRNPQDRDITSPDEFRIPPVFNYARTLSWSRTVYMTSLYCRTAWQRSNARVGVDGTPIPGNVCDDVPRESRLGNRAQIREYCHPGVNVRLPRAVFMNMIKASIISLLLQWGTTGAAIITTWFTPTVGLGCRSLAYIIYGGLSTTVWFLLVSSSVLEYYAHQPIGDPDVEVDRQHTPSRSSRGDSDVAIPLQEDIQPNSDASTNSEEPVYSNTRRTMAWIADLLRWAGKLLAIINAIGIVANSVFQYAGVYDTCYCDSSIFTWGSSAFNVIVPDSNDLHLARSAWIGGIALSLTCSAGFVGSIYLIRDSLP